MPFSPERPPTFDVVVEDIIDEAEGVIALRLARADGTPLPTWEPGAHLDLFLPNGLERQYSLCGDPRKNACWTIAVLREPESRGGSAWLHTNVEKGMTLTITGPRNLFPLVDAEHYRLVAGGIGITPLLAMINELEARTADWRLLYGGRERASMAFVEQLARWSDRVAVRPQNEYGLLDLSEFLGTPRPGTAIYSCGPEGLLEAIEERCKKWPPGTLHVERFKPRPHALEDADTPFEVVLASTGETYPVPIGETILDALETAGVEVESSCREGTCGTCETTVLEGVPDHRDSFLSEDERESGEMMMICCSRARGARIILDL